MTHWVNTLLHRRQDLNLVWPSVSATRVRDPGGVGACCLSQHRPGPVRNPYLKDKVKGAEGWLGG